MNNSFYTCLAICLIVLSAFTVYNSSTWNLTDDYEIRFISDNPEGIFKSLDGTIIFNPSDLSNSSFNMSVDVNSINTGRGMQNKHAVSDKWFDANKYPKIIFTSKSINASGSTYSVTGDLSIKDVTKTITFPFTFEDNTFKGTFDIDRMEYHIGTMNGMDKKASQYLKIELNVPVTN